MAIIQVATALHIFKYDTPVVPLQQGVVWRVNGVFKLAHIIDLKQIQNIIDKTTEETSVITDTRVASLICHFLEEATNGITRLAGVGMDMCCRVTRRIRLEYHPPVSKQRNPK